MSKEVIKKGKFDPEKKCSTIRKTICNDDDKGKQKLDGGKLKPPDSFTQLYTECQVKHIKLPEHFQHRGTGSSVQQGLVEYLL